MIFLETIEVVNGDMWLNCEARLTGENWYVHDQRWGRG